MGKPVVQPTFTGAKNLACELACRGTGHEIAATIQGIRVTGRYWVAPDRVELVCAVGTAYAPRGGATDENIALMLLRDVFRFDEHVASRKSHTG